MCGLAGILFDRTRARVSFDDLARMAAMLRHRGPDGWGMYLDDHVGLAHTRLSILDLAGGAQPMGNSEGDAFVTFNGEIFNHVELRAELESRGHRFRTRSDTEVILHAYRHWGDKAWEHFNGQFAFALWDARRKQLWLVRDRVGILPLFYAQSGGRVVFASEIKAIFATGFISQRPDPHALAQIFTLWSAVPPATVFNDIKSVEPGSAIRFDERLIPTRTRFWQACFGVPPTHSASQQSRVSADQAASQLEDHLTAAVNLRLRADVPVGAYLSGGLDSSVIASLIRQSESAPLQTFSLRFDDPNYDETAPQRTMAQLLGTKHHKIVVGATDIQGALADVTWHAETPLLRTGPAPMFLLSKLVREAGMKVVLTGEGADEFLAGYDLFKENAIRRFWARQPNSQARPALLARLHRYVAADRSNTMWQEFFRAGLTQTDDPFYSHRIRWNNTAWTQRLFSKDVRAEIDQSRMEDDLSRVMPQGWMDWSPLERAQMIEIATFMTPYLLTSQGDRMAMAHGVEVRYPYLDPDVIDFCQSLPRECKMRGLRDKVALRRIASRRLPEEIWKRPKWPYRAPIAGALFGPDAPEYVRELLSPSRIDQYGLLDATVVNGLLTRARQNAVRIGEREEMALLGALTLQMLAAQFADEFEARLRESLRRLNESPPQVKEDRRKPAGTAGIPLAQPTRPGV